jgi:hypothetical protein
MPPAAPTTGAVPPPQPITAPLPWPLPRTVAATAVDDPLPPAQAVPDPAVASLPDIDDLTAANATPAAVPKPVATEPPFPPLPKDLA